MSPYYSYYPTYVSAAERRARAQKQLKKLEKQGLQIQPVGTLAHRIKIAASFWGRSWCRHLESFSDYENRLPRGRTYVRNGSVLHLALEPGTVHALVQGSELYEVIIRIQPLPADKWARIKSQCQGKIGSLIELLQGKISDEIMSIVAHPAHGLFPSPKEITLRCTCPDSAHLCKHLAAVLYGIGARLDTQPELLFKLRGVDQSDLIAIADTPTALHGKTRSTRRLLDTDALGSVFGIDLDSEAPLPPKPTSPPSAKKKTKKTPTKPPKSLKPKPKPRTKRKAAK